MLYVCMYITAHLQFTLIYCKQKLYELLREYVYIYITEMLRMYQFTASTFQELGAEQNNLDTIFISSI